jgi:hypothetical protein
VRLTAAHRELIKLLAREAVDHYLDEQQQATDEEFSPNPDE